MTTPLTRRLHATTLVLAALLVLAACGQAPGQPGSSPTTWQPSPDAMTDPTPDQTAPDDSTTPDGADVDVDEMAFTDCEADRYTVAHPAAWNTNSDDGLLGPCEIFHPGGIDVPERPRDIDLHYAALLHIDAVDFDGRATSDNPNEVIEEREVTVDGRRARVVEYRSTGHALTPEGEYSYTWVIDLDGEVLVATTSSVGETDYERDKRVLDRMVTDELRIHGLDDQ